MRKKLSFLYFQINCAFHYFKCYLVILPQPPNLAPNLYLPQSVGTERNVPPQPKIGASIFLDRTLLNRVYFEENCVVKDAI